MKSVQRQDYWFRVSDTLRQELKSLMATGRNVLLCGACRWKEMVDQCDSSSEDHASTSWHSIHSRTPHPLCRIHSHIPATNILLHIFNIWEQHKWGRKLQINSIIYFLHMSLNMCVELKKKVIKLACACLFQILKSLLLNSTCAPPACHIWSVLKTGGFKSKTKGWATERLHDVQVL